MNINNGKTGNVNIPGALHSTGGDGDGQVGGVVAYAGDVYDETLGKNQKEINQTLLDGSGDSNVVAVALNDLNEKVEEQEKVTSSGLNDLNDKTDNLSKDIEDLEKTTSSSLNDLNDKVDNLNDKVEDNEKVTSTSLNDLNEKVDNDEKTTAVALNDLNDKIDDTAADIISLQSVISDIESNLSSSSSAPTYSAGAGIIISNNTINVDASQLNYDDLNGKPDLDPLIATHDDRGVVLSYANQRTYAIGDQSVAYGHSTNA